MTSYRRRFCWSLLHLLGVSLIGGIALRVATAASPAPAPIQKCFVAYADRDYQGASTTLCNSTDKLLNDTYSSLRVPQGLAVRAYENADHTGLARTYYGDTPYVGNLYNDKISAFSLQPFNGNDFYMVITSDPQVHWGYCSDGPGTYNCRREQAVFGSDIDSASLYYNQQQAAAVTQLEQYLGGGRVGGLIVNGDLTAYGKQHDSLERYRSLWENDVPLNVYPGLGNHDYDNNLRSNDTYASLGEHPGCYMNTCATGMINFLQEQVASLNPISFDYQVHKVKFDWAGFHNVKDHTGSLAYAWDIGNVHFVQMNNFPSYTAEWRTWNWGAARRDDYHIESALAWLKKDLQQAEAAGKQVIVNFHDPQGTRSTAENAEILKVMCEHKVAAIFGGHWHHIVGEVGGVSCSDHTIPMYLSGSAHYGTFLVARFVKSDGVYIWRMQVDQLGTQQLRVLDAHGDAADFANPTSWQRAFVGGGTDYAHHHKYPK